MGLNKGSGDKGLRLPFMFNAIFHPTPTLDWLLSSASGLRTLLSAPCYSVAMWPQLACLWPFAEYSPGSSQA